MLLSGIRRCSRKIEICICAQVTVIYSCFAVSYLYIVVIITDNLQINSILILSCKRYTKISFRLIFARPELFWSWTVLFDQINDYRDTLWVFIRQICFTNALEKQHFNKLPIKTPLVYFGPSNIFSQSLFCRPCPRA